MFQKEDIVSDKVRDYAGRNDFIWWIGYVEDREDPLRLGRCRVRCYGWHADNKVKLPTEGLPWALVSCPPNQQDPYAIWEGNLVFGFFMDGENAQEPVIVGVIANIPLTASNPKEPFNDPRTDAQLAVAPRTPQSKTYRKDGSGIAISEKQKAEHHPRNLDEPTTPRMARNESIEKTFIQERRDNAVTGVPTVVSGSWNERQTEYDTKYPYNNVLETESGHLFEFDDTFGKERIHLAHRNGSFQEMFPDGDKVEKVTKDHYEVIMGDEKVYIMGKCQITVQGDAEIYVQKNAYAKIGGNADVNIERNVVVKVGGNYNEEVGGTYKVSSGGNMSFNAPRIDFN
jgi:hypothetical protein